MKTDMTKIKEELLLLKEYIPVTKIERKLGMSHALLHHGLSGKRNFPKKWIDPLMDFLATLPKKDGTEPEIKIIPSKPKYGATNNGNIIRLDTGEILKGTIISSGYNVVSIDNLKNRKTRFTHRLVAEAWIPNPDNKPFINHKNGIKTDNRVDNLEWCTCKENIRHAWENGLNKITPYQRENMKRLHKEGRFKYKTTKVIDIKTGKVFNSVNDAAASVNLKRTTLIMMLRGKNPNKTTLKYL